MTLKHDQPSRPRKSDGDQGVPSAPDVIPHNLPSALDSFVGREQAAAAVASLLEVSRLVTLTGGPGVGKTRLALHVAQAHLGRFTDGTWFVELAAVNEASLVAQAVAAVLRLPEQRGQNLTETLFNHLRGRRVLLLVDNCEHLVNGCATLIDTLLRSCETLSVLVTSQEPLGISGERAWRVPSLDLPGSDAGARLEDLLACPSVRLFCERAAAVQPDFAMTTEVASSVADICRRLDGIPLAIELAAARAAVLTPPEIAANLDDRFRLLIGGSRSTLPRHQTLLQALQWSHSLLTSPEQALLRRLSVFAGGTTLEAAEEVCVGGEVEAGQVFNLLASLVNKSLVLADTSGAQTRYRLIETVRHFGRDELREAGESASTQARHAAWCLRFAEQVEPCLAGPDQKQGLELVQAEHDNIRAALAWATGEVGQTEPDVPFLALRLAGALTVFWRVRGSFSEGRGWLDVALTQADGAPPTVRAKALWGTGFLAAMLGEEKSAVPALEESVAVFEESGDIQGLARALLLLGNCLVFKHPDDAVPLLECSVNLARQSGDAWCLAHALAICGLGYVRRSDTAQARAFLEEAIAVARENRDDQGLRLGLTALAEFALSEGLYPLAEASSMEALPLLRQLGDTYSTSVALRVLGDVALGRGDRDFDAAQALLGESLDLARQSGNPAAIGSALCSLGRLARQKGEPVTAEGLFSQCISFIQEAGECPPVVALLDLGELATSLGDLPAARARFEQALALARRSVERPLIARAACGLGNVCRLEGKHAEAVSLLHESLGVNQEIGHLPGTSECLEVLAGLAADEGLWEKSARLLGAAGAVRELMGISSSSDPTDRHGEITASVREALGDDSYESALVQGRALSIDEAVDYASKGRGRRPRQRSGWDALTKAEWAVAALAAEGLNNVEIAERLFVTRGTVKVHLSHIFAKLGLRSRTELAAQLAARAQEAGDEGSSRYMPSGR